MTLNHLRIFAEVVKCGKMSLAAEHLYISQPTVSQTISELEKYYKVRLFERYPRRLCVTYPGTILYQYAQEVLDAFSRLEDTMQGLTESSPIRLGATVTVGATIVNEIITEYEAVRPASVIRLSIGNTTTIEQMLANNELDIAIVEGTIHRHDMIVEPIIADYLVIFCGNHHPFSQHSDLLARELEGQPFVMWEKGSGTRSMVDHYIQSQDLNVNVKIECTNFDMIKKFVMDYPYLSAMSIRLVEREVREKSLHVLHIKDWIGARNFSLVFLKNKYLSEEIKTFISLCQTYKSNNINHLLKEVF